ncbi:ATP/GTP-binding protein, partial [Cryobacterium sp. MLB-32]
PLILKNHRAVVFDKKDEGGEGEYAALTRRMGAEPLRFDPDGTGTRFNLIDPLIARGTGLQGQMLLINAVARIARDDTAATEWEEKATRYALQQMFRSFHDTARVSTTTDLMPYLGTVPLDQDLSAGARERFHQAGLSIRFGLENLLETYAGVFDGETSRNVDLSHKLTTFDISQLPDSGPAIPTVMAIGNMWLMGRLRQERGYITNVIYEEGWHMIGGPSAQLVKSNQKLSRSLGISNVFVMHKGTDIPVDSPGYTVVQEAQTVYAFRQDRPEDAR